MNPDDESYTEFVELVGECIENAAAERDIDADVTIEEGEVSLVAVTGTIAEEKPIEMSAVISADLAANLQPIRDEVGVNETVEFPEENAIRPRLTFEREGDVRVDTGEDPEMDNVERTGPVRSKEELAEECEHRKE